MEARKLWVVMSLAATTLLPGLPVEAQEGVRHRRQPSYEERMEQERPRRHMPGRVEDEDRSEIRRPRRHPRRDEVAPRRPGREGHYPQYPRPDEEIDEGIVDEGVEDFPPVDADDFPEDEEELYPRYPSEEDELEGPLVDEQDYPEVRRPRRHPRRNEKFNAPSPRAQQDFSKARRASGLSRHIPLYEGRVGNAMATMLPDSNGRLSPAIVYDRAFMSELARENPWAPISVLAHEIGHIVKKHLGGRAIDPWDAELEADEFSGCVLARMGASRDDATSAEELLYTEKGSDSHPPSPRRLDAITDGWERCHR